MGIMPTDKRGNPREPGYAKVWIKGLEKPAYLRDMNESGIKIGIPDTVELAPGGRLTLISIPEETSGIPSFELDVEIRWIRAEEIYTTVGTSISGYTKPIYHDSYEQLLAYYLSQA